MSFVCYEIVLIKAYFF